MKRVLMVGLLIVVAIVVGLMLISQQDATNTAGVDAGELVTPAPSAVGATRDTVAGQAADSDPTAAIPGSAQDPLVAPTARPAEIVRLADGDSFDIRWLDTNESDEVRLLGINAPEANACFGAEARGVLEVLTDGAEIQVQQTERDEFGRAIANVWADGVFVNATLVRLGAALALSDQGQHADVIRDAQATATATQAGLWNPEFCGITDGADLAIAHIEANAPGQDHLNPNGEWIDIINFGTADADLTDWSIRDESTRHRFGFPDGFTLRSDAAVRVFSGCGNDTSDELYWCDGDPVWNNSGDTGFLVTPDGAFADTFPYS